jgi:hypothetical protein
LALQILQPPNRLCSQLEILVGKGKGKGKGKSKGKGKIKVKFPLCSPYRHEETEVYFHAFLNSALNGIGQLQAPAALPYRKSAGTSK